MQIYQSYQQGTNRNQIVLTLYEIGNDAQQYFERSASQRRGGPSYENWIMPDKFKKSLIGSFSFVAKRKRVNISGIGAELGINGITNVRAVAKIDSSGVQVIIIN